MLLAAILRMYPDELRADMQEVYGIDIDLAPMQGHSAIHVAALAAQLPHGARIHRAEEQDCAWSLTDVLLAALLNEFRTMEWAMLDKRRRGPRPQPVGPSYMAGRHRLKARAMPVDELMEILSRPRTEAAGGC